MDINTMSNVTAKLASVCRSVPFFAAVWVACAAARGQSPIYTIPAQGGFYPMPGPPQNGHYPLAAQPYPSYLGQPRMHVDSRGLETTPQPGHAIRRPLARLVRNSDSRAGAPPFALADQAGTIQRLVEPVPGVDLEPHLGQVVIVRHDTGRTLLASQLELPPQPLLPVVASDGGDSFAGNRAASRPRPGAAGFSGETVQFVDDDDATTELISDEAATTQSVLAQPRGGAPQGGSATPPNRTITPLEVEDAGETIIEGPFFGGPMSGGPIGDDPLALETWPDGQLVEEMGPCPHCGGYHGPPGCNQGTRMDGLLSWFGTRPDGQFCRVYGEVELNFLRLHVMENAVGKLSESYKLSPRVIIGFEGSSTLDGRVRYGMYDRETQILGGGSVRAEFDVLDIEATQRFPAGRSDVVIAAGLRLADIDLDDDDGDEVGANLIGMTLAADARTPLCSFQHHRIFFVYGGRLSILGGDWGGDGGSDFIPAPQQDDNVIVDEIYAGVQFTTSYQECDIYARLAFEIQNWHSDALAQNAGSDSIGFIGPGVHLGAAF